MRKISVNPNFYWKQIVKWIKKDFSKYTKPERGVKP